MSYIKHQSLTSTLSDEPTPLWSACDLTQNCISHRSNHDPQKSFPKISTALLNNCDVEQKVESKFVYLSELWILVNYQLLEHISLPAWSRSQHFLSVVRRRVLLNNTIFYWFWWGFCLLVPEIEASRSQRSVGIINKNKEKG
jgi:hypothetical protein